MFPIFAIPIMIISLLLLILKFIIYLVEEILGFVQLLLRNITALVKAFQNGSATSVMAIANKLGSLICIFQNLFVLLSIFGVIIQIFKDLLGALFSIPPCDDNNNGNPNKCCTPDVCPAIIKNGPYTNNTGTLQYVSQVGYDTSALFSSLNLPPSFTAIFSNSSSIRTESWQLYDPFQTQAQAFINIVDAYDVPSDTSPFPIFFPTDAAYSATTQPTQAAYNVSLQFFYDPSVWNGRTGTARTVQINNCIVLQAPTTNLVSYDNTNISEPTGVFYLVGGQGYEADGVTVLTGFASDGYTPITAQATLENFLHQPAINTAAPVFTPPINLVGLTYTFTPILPVLLNKNLVTLGCEPAVALNRTFVNTVIAGNIGINTALVTNIVNGTGSTNGVPNVFPDPVAAQECLSTALNALSSNLTTQGVAEFQAMTTVCLNTLETATNSALGNMITVSVNPCESSFTLSPTTQFTTLPINVSVILNENSGNNVATNLPATAGATVAAQITAFPTFGVVGPFTYDGYSTFTASLTSTIPGNGQIMVAFDNNILCTNDLAVDPPTHVLQSIDYNFVYTNVPATGEPRRTPTDIADDKGGS